MKYGWQYFKSLALGKLTGKIKANIPMDDVSFWAVNIVINAQVPKRYTNLQTHQKAVKALSEKLHHVTLRKHCHCNNPMWQDLLGEVLWRQASHMAPGVYTTNQQHNVPKCYKYCKDMIDHGCQPHCSRTSYCHTSRDMPESRRVPCPSTSLRLGFDHPWCRLAPLVDGRQQQQQQQEEEEEERLIPESHHILICIQHIIYPYW